MANRICFLSTPNLNLLYKEQLIEFEYFPGFSLTQKRKSIESLHRNIQLLDRDLHILEVSTKSPDSLGHALSAFNLKYRSSVNNNEYFIENVFQSSKVFDYGGPYRDLLHVPPLVAKRDPRLKESGRLRCFNFEDVIWELEPKSAFYDWLYINSLHEKPELVSKVVDFSAFTDIEFNHKKSLNCQARAVAIFVSLVKKAILEESLINKESFKKVYQSTSMC